MRALAVIVIATVLQACKPAVVCDAKLSYSLNIVIPGASRPVAAMGGAGGGSAEYECAAAVTVTGPIREGDPHCSAREEHCRCTAGTSTGSFTITVELDGATQEKTVVVEDDECGVVTEQVTFDF